MEGGRCDALFWMFLVDMNFVTLPRSFYEPSAEAVAPRLLGHWLIRRSAKGFSGGAIVETEAYLVGDPASHGFVGETDRNRTLYGPPGYAYVYLIYGMHFCINAVCRRAGHAEAVLIRAIEVDFGEGLMHAHRPALKTISLTDGPGKLCAALAVNRKQNGADLCDVQSPVFIAANPQAETFCQERGPVITGPRIGITRAADMPLRFYLAGSPFISRRPAAPARRSIARRDPPNRARTKC